VCSSFLIKMYNRRVRERYFYDAVSKGYTAASLARVAWDMYDSGFPNKRQRMAPVLMETDTITNQKGGSFAPISAAAGTMNFYANPRLKRTLKGSVEYWDYYNYEIAWLNSTKAFMPICHIGVRDQYINNSSVANMSPFSSRRWFDLQATQGQPASNFVNAQTAPNSDWIGCSKADIKMDFINLTTLPCQLRVTWYRCMEDTSVSALQAYKTSIENNKLFSSDFATNPLYVLDPTVTGNETLINYVNPSVAIAENMTTTPYINLSSRKHFREKYKKLSSKSWIMNGGSTYQLFTRGDVNCFQSFQSVTDGTDPYMKGSVVCILECQGLASHLKITENGDQLEVDGASLAAGRIGVVVSRHLNIKALTPTVTKWDSTVIGVGSLPIRGTVEQNRQIVNFDLAAGNAQQEQ